MESSAFDTSPCFFLTAAEHSGDALGAALIQALKRKFPAAQFVGVGGDLMAAAGCRLLANPVKRSAMFLGALITESRRWWALLRQIKRELAILKPSVVIPIDSSFINLRIAAAAKQMGFKVCYYVAPQVWASRPGRIKKIAACVDTLCCILPFEEKYFTDRHVHAVYVGHPMFDLPVPPPRQLDPPLPDSEGRGGPHIAIFPGSRRAEVDKQMPPMLKILAQIKGRFVGTSFVAVAPSKERAWQIRHHLRKANISLDIRVGGGGDTEAIIDWADLLLTKSGTATLQIARQAKPMVVMFAAHRWEWAVAKHFILTEYISLVNILASRELVPEFIPFYGSPMPIARECIALLADSDRRAQMSQELKELVKPLLPTDGILAADRVADEAAKLIG